MGVVSSRCKRTCRSVPSTSRGKEAGAFGGIIYCRPTVGGGFRMATHVHSIGETLPARYYTDPAIFAEELERFFCQGWICAGRADQISNPGDFFLREIADESIIINRDNSGQVHAFYNVCRHRGTRICTAAEGKFAGRIQCPYHGWTYALDGKLIGAPHMENLPREDYPLNPVGAELWDGHIFITLDPRPAPLASQLDDLQLSLHPDYMMTHTLWPRAVDRTEIICEWHFHPQEMAKPDFQADDAVKFWDLTNKEDWGISQLSQAGIKSRAYKPGPYSVREGLPHAFDQMVLERERRDRRNHSELAVQREEAGADDRT